MTNHFNAKGKVAEDYIQKLCNDTYTAEFCFRSPKLRKKSGDEEICDILLVLGDVAIIWQIKNIKLKNGKFNSGEIQKGIRQCRGAKRKLLQLKSLTSKNIDGHDKTIRPQDIKKFYLITAVEGGHEDMSEICDLDNKRGDVHIFFEDMTQFATSNFDTVKDITRYLEDKERCLNASNGPIVVGGLESDFAAHYIRNGRSFSNEKTNFTYLDIEGVADKLLNDRDYQEKRDADSLSSVWDYLINEQRRAVVRESHGIQESMQQEVKDKILTAMMSHDRLQRRVLGKSFMDAASKSLRNTTKSNIFRRYFPSENVTYVFVFYGDGTDDPSSLQNALLCSCYLARNKYPKNETTIGILTDREMINNPTVGFNWLYMSLSEEDMEQHQFAIDMCKMHNKTHSFIEESYMEHEYPSEINRGGRS